MELVILGIILLAVILIAKGGMTYLRKIKAETGYNPVPEIIPRGRTNWQETMGLQMRKKLKRMELI